MSAIPSPPSRALVLGASGGIGGEVARQLRDTGWDVLALKRGLSAETEQRDGLTWLRGDAMERQDVLDAAKGCAVIVHAVNPPGYRHWAEQVVPMVDNTVAAAIAERATVVLPGTVYNYGPDAYRHIDEDAPQRPLTRKGRIRVQLEERLRDATRHGARTIVLRAGDFFGPRAGNSWFAQGLIQPGKPLRTIKQPGKPGVGHQWAYLPDVAQTMLALIERRDALEPFARFHMEGHWDADGTAMIEAIRRVATRYGMDPKVSPFPWWLTKLAAPFVPTLREMQEMHYLWQQPVHMDGSRLEALLDGAPHTPLEVAVEATLRGLGCLPVSDGARLRSSASQNLT
ncbi:SDR family oxidoreductase [Luteibacter sp. UNCMF366Tsu5.1]|uniref:SDR family oxidoreductase n=1 Tax=Luteibacter sp. UNCMF366Tsu5.1 TaxID=1502758 RepID=UPI000908F528|nr:SDR family oxidoreductase [Luteibacter sp. UNCMF366Tsu5.1]SFW70823.1 Nucleoside-diphosphate-sugar epimerase [Luteibacter sp. UNCMF366Tsu5.1]